MKTNFEYFQIQKRMLQLVRVEKVDAKNGSFVQFPCFLSVLILALSKYVHSLLFRADLNKKSKSIKAIHIMDLKSLITHFQKMVLSIMLLLTVSEILEFEVEELC